MTPRTAKLRILTALLDLAVVLNCLTERLYRWADARVEDARGDVVTEDDRERMMQ